MHTQIWSQRVQESLRNIQAIVLPEVLGKARVLLVLIVGGDQKLG